MRLTENDRLCIPVPLYHCFGMVLGNMACLTHDPARLGEFYAAVFDAESLQPWAERYGASVLCSFARVEGEAVGVVASQPMQKGGVMDVPALAKEVAFCDLCDTFNLPIAFLQDVPPAVVVTDGLSALPTDKSFELWFVRGDAPISAGTFEVGADGRATALLQGDMQAGDVIAVTVEPAGGSPNGLPSTDPIVVIPTA